MDILVSTDWLAQNLNADDLVILDASAHLPSANRDPAAEFLAQHILGARYLDLPSLKDGTSPVPSALPRLDQFEQRLRQLGVRNTDRVVLYDNSALHSSARAYFIFRMFGFDNVAILDGGLDKWVGENRPVEAGTPQVEPSDFTAQCDDRSRVRSKAHMLGNCASCEDQVVDARDAGRFTGETSDTVHGLAGGHIPGARNLHFASLFNEDGTFRDLTELREIFAESGLDLEKPIIGSCGSGMTASVLLFALELLGNDNAALYDGSWSEWGADPLTPKEEGPAR
ncbi:sulfurtransferase [Altererythrobacter luteolus]|uniref:Sulfurtransferase n=1 Tax=Pontixanthobacter luteolus TaxID=295089 RepID=A0A6I4V279_9SPHN|nr:sulfurtransferase [Pontixanthobacter luteolus]MXP47176.1 sulfurtransferase [Pontixanthobacter luteolus]